jgi:Phosphoesterase family
MNLNRREILRNSLLVSGVALVNSKYNLRPMLPSLTSLPTIWDRLAAAGVSGNYYFNNVPFLTLWGLKYLGITKTYDDFKSAAKNGMLPAVSYVDPNFTTIDDGLGNDDHPHADIRRGHRFLHDTSILKLIEWRWGLAPLTPRDASSEHRRCRQRRQRRDRRAQGTSSLH